MPPAMLLAHGAGAPSSSPWMRRYQELLCGFVELRTFDYPYIAAGRRTPDRLPALINTHRDQLSRFRAALAEAATLVPPVAGLVPPVAGLVSPVAGPSKVLLAGKSMGGRVGCHVSLAETVSGLVCFGYPLRGQNGKLRDEVLLALRCPILFVQGTRDALCPLPELAEVRRRMIAPSELFVVEGGDHSLEVTKTGLKQRGTTQAEVEQAIRSVVQRFVAEL